MFLSSAEPSGKQWSKANGPLLCRKQATLLSRIQVIAKVQSLLEDGLPRLWMQLSRPSVWFECASWTGVCQEGQRDVDFTLLHNGNNVSNLWKWSNLQRRSTLLIRIYQGNWIDFKWRLASTDSHFVLLLLLIMYPSLSWWSKSQEMCHFALSLTVICQTILCNASHHRILALSMLSAKPTHR